MKLLNLATVAASVGVLVAAAPGTAPSQHRAAGAAFSIHQIYNEQYSQIGRGPRALARTYKKYGVEMPRALVSTLEDISAKIAAKAGLSARAANDSTNGGKGMDAKKGEGDIKLTSHRRGTGYPRTLRH